MGLLFAVLGISLAGIAVLLYKKVHIKEVARYSDEDKDSEK